MCQGNEALKQMLGFRIENELFPHLLLRKWHRAEIRDSLLQHQKNALPLKPIENSVFISILNVRVYFTLLGKVGAPATAISMMLRDTCNEPTPLQERISHLLFITLV